LITILDYGLGNVGSIRNMLKKVGVNSIITSKVEDILSANAIIIPGVGSFDQGMNNLKNLNCFDLLNQIAKSDKVPILGICLGMQLMTKKSEEGVEDGLGWIDAEVLKFSDSHGPVPNMGWGFIKDLKTSNIYRNIGREYKFYFVHSFFVNCFDKNDILSETNYGDDFVSSFQKKKILGVQFHPEKSHQFGINFFKNWLDHYSIS
tara:strand:+ start:1269 stop:1883 length:615 start_codon:yes stop_codon:yes gene_type:complete